VVGLLERLDKGAPGAFDSLFGSWPPIVTYMPSAAEPASVGVDDTLKPSGPRRRTFELSPSTETLSLISWPPLLETIPPRKIAPGFLLAMPWNSDW